MKQRIGLLVDNLEVSKQLHDFIELSLSSDSYEVTTLILNNPKIPNKNFLSSIFRYLHKRGLLKFVNKIYFLLISKLEQQILKKKSSYKDFYSSFNLSSRHLEIIEVEPTLSDSGLFVSYKDSDLDKIKEARLNLLVRGGRGILKGGILTICPNGIISFHHADNDVNRGGPSGFWEVYKKSPTTGFIIQRLNENLDGGDVLFKGFIQTDWLYSRNKINLYETSTSFLHKTIENIICESSITESYPKIPYSETLYTIPNVLESTNYLFKTLFIFFSKKANRFFGIRNRWNVAYQFTNNWQGAELRKSIKILNPKNHFLADPFILKRDNKHYCFVEDYDYAEEKGSIAVYEINREGHIELGKALEEDFHLAYPFLFEYENELYMCPETNEINEIRLYKCVEFPLKWTFEKVLMENISAVDTCIFCYKEKWWLISNIDYSTAGQNSSQLHIFHASTPLSDEWIPHVHNPVIFDPSKARNGGFIQNQSKYYRVYQRQAFNIYGGSFGVAQITELDEENYLEESLFEVEPHFFPKITRTHTFNYSDGLLVLDYAKEENKNS